MKSLSRKFILLSVVAAFSATLLWGSETARAWIRKGLAPFYWAAARVDFHPLRAAGEFFSSRRALREKAACLKQELFEARQRLEQTREIQKENDRLRDLLQFQKEVQWNAVPARVVGRDPTQWFRGITIDRGSAHGLKLHMPVVTHEGLVGKVTELSASMAQVQLIVDYGSRAGGMLQESREVGILAGEGTAGCRLIYVARDATVKEGEAVLTSGVGSLFPKGLMIGRATAASLEKNGLYRTVSVEPSVDFGKLEEVLVLVSVQ